MVRVSASVEDREGRWTGVPVMVTKIASTEQVDYRLHGGSGCDPRTADQQLDYRGEDGERPLMWIGSGLREFGIEPGTALGEGEFEKARALMAGADPVTGEQLVTPKLAVYEDAKVPLAELVEAVELAALAAGEEPVDLFTSGRRRESFLRAVRVVDQGGSSARLRADEASLLVADAGLDAGQVWGSGVLEAAVANLTTTRTEAGVDGSVTTVEVPRRRSVGNLGYDVTFTFPKSYSVLMAFADQGKAEGIEGQLNASVTDTFDWLQEHTSYGMRGKHGNGRTARIEKTSGFSGWTMTHRSARPVDGAPVGDPHWHMHVTIANMAKGQDGQWSTIAAGGRDLIRHSRAADMLTQAQARHRLAEEFGCRFVRSARTGEWEIAHIPEPVIQAFSKRGVAIADMLEGFGFDAATASRAQRLLAADRTREAKTEQSVQASDATLRDLWQDQARRMGVDPGQVAAAATAGQRDANRMQVDAAFVREVMVRLQSGEDGLTATRRRFTTVDAIAAVADCLPEGAHSIADVEALTATVLADAGFVELGTSRDRHTSTGPVNQIGADHMGHATEYTTVDVVEAEATILGAAAASRDGQGAVAIHPNVAAAARGVVEAGQGYSLSAEQVAVMQRLTTSDRMLDAVVGGPGTGKTTLMRAARAAWEAEGFAVGGAATQATTGHNLLAESGIESATIASILVNTDASAVARLSVAAGFRDAEFIVDPHNPTDEELDALRRAPLIAEHLRPFVAERGEHGGLAPLDVLIVDEASMTDDRSLARLIAESQRTGTKVVLIGDDKQLRGVGCGSVFARVHNEVDGLTMIDNRRQKDIDERLAITEWREGRYEAALASWEGRGKLAVTETSDQALAAMVGDWMRMRDGAPDPHTQLRGLVMLAHTNAAVDRINDAAQAVRVANGELGPITGYTGRRGATLNLAEGDQVIVRLNDRNEANHTGDDVLNGFRGIVERIDDAGVQVGWETDTAQGRVTQRAVLDRDYIAKGGLELGYAMTVHRSQGLTVGDKWNDQHGNTQGGTVLKFGPSDAASSLVAWTRHTDEVRLYVAREQVEDSYTTARNGGVPGDDAERTRRVVNALAAHARATETNVNDRPVHDDLGLDVDATDTSSKRDDAGAQRAERAAAIRQEMHERLAARKAAKAATKTPMRGTRNRDRGVDDDLKRGREEGTDRSY